MNKYTSKIYKDKHSTEKVNDLEVIINSRFTKIKYQIVRN